MSPAKKRRTRIFLKRLRLETEYPELKFHRLAFQMVWPSPDVVRVITPSPVPTLDVIYGVGYFRGSKP